MRLQRRKPFGPTLLHVDAVRTSFHLTTLAWAFWIEIPICRADKVSRHGS
jgi:hypothetical protein